MDNNNQRRRNGKIDRLEATQKDAVNQMLLSGASYREVVEYLREYGVQLSRTAVCTYARKFLATTQMIRVASDNFKMLMDDIDRHPDLDTTEGIIRLMSNSMLQTLANTKPKDWQGMDMANLLKEANALVRVTAQKRRVDAQNRSTLEAAMEGNKQALYDVLHNQHPELYRQVMEVVKQMGNNLQGD
jgi:hypothetical protein